MKTQTAIASIRLSSVCVVAAILHFGCASDSPPKPLTTLQIPQEYKAHIHEVGLIHPARPEQATVTDSEALEAGDRVGNFMGETSLGVGYIVGIAPLSIGYAVSSLQTKAMTTKFADATKDLPCNPSQWLVDDLQTRLTNAGYSVKILDRSRRDCVKFLDPTEYANMGGGVDATLDVVLWNYGYQKNYGGQNGGKAYAPEAAAGFRVVLPDGRVAWYGSFNNLDVDPKTLRPRWGLPQYQFANIKEMASDPQHAVNGLKAAVLRASEKMADCFTIHPCKVYVYRLDAHYSDPSEESFHVALEIDGRVVSGFGDSLNGWRLQPRECLYLTLPPGRHTFRILVSTRPPKVEASLEVDLKEGSTSYIRVDHKVKGRFMRGPVFPGEVVLVSEEEGRRALSEFSQPPPWPKPARER